MNGKRIFTTASILLLLASICPAQTEPVTAPGAEVEKLAGGLGFTEGPAADVEGNLYFTDIPNNRIHKWSIDPCEPGLSMFMENTEGSNGLYFDKYGKLIACQGSGRKVVSIDPYGNVTIIASEYQGKPFNSPNDCWIDMKRGIYFTDPRYGGREGMEQDGEHVYYLTPDRKNVIRVIDDLVRPNGIIGTPDGKKLYVADHGDGKTFVYTINEDGTLSNKKLFASEGSDGMTIDEEGNVYLTTNAVAVYNKNGEKIQTIDVPETPANVTFSGKDKQTLFITARTSLYSIKMRVKGAKKVNQFKYEPIDIATFPVVPWQPKSESNTKIKSETKYESKFKHDIINTDFGDIKISLIGHATLMFEYNEKIIHVDPVGAEADYSKMPKADAILITHAHGDHLDSDAINKIRKSDTYIVLIKACAEKVFGGIIMNNGDTKIVKGLKIEAVPAYNIVHMRSDNNPYHPKGDGNGYIITFGDKRVYIAGDTENTPEMKKLKDIDVAFLPMNLPYTMTPEMVADAAKAFKPKILYPYHYGQTDPQKLVDLLKDSKEIEVRIRDMK